MNSKKSWFFLLPVLLFTAIFGAYCHNGPQPTTREGLILKSVYDLLQVYHVSPTKIDDEFSKKAYNEFLTNLDPGKRFFTQEDLNGLKEFEFKLDDEFKAGQLDFFNKISEVFTKSIDRSEKYYKQYLDLPFDFTKNEEIELDEDKLPFAKNESELNEVWRKAMKYEFLNRYYDDLKNLEKDKKTKPKDSIVLEIRNEVKESMENWFKRLHEMRSSDKFELYINTLTHLYDPHSDYFSPKEKEDFNINMSGKLEGIGARLQQDREYTKVASIVPGGPAWKQKELEANDLILSVQQKDQEPVDIKGMRIDDVVKMVRGKKGTWVILKVKKSTGVEKEISILRDEVIMDEGFARSAILNQDNSLSDVGYIKLPRFYADFDNPNGPSAAKDIAEELEKLKKAGAKSLILDLRNNGGGSLQEVVEMSGLFIEQGPVVQVASKNNKNVYNDPDPAAHFDGPMVVLINSNSASASEIITACLQDYKRAVVVGGESTFGKGSVQRFVNLDNTVRVNSVDVAGDLGAQNSIKPLGELKVTIQKYYRINGGSVQLKGAEPDVVVPDIYSYLLNGEKEYEHPLSYDVIEKQNFNQNVFVISNLDEVKSKSAERLKTNEQIKLLDQNAKRYKNIKDQTKYPLNYDAYATLVKQRDEEAKQYEKVGKDPIQGLKAINLEADMAYINMDQSRVGRNEDFLKSITKDLQISECINILKDIKK